MTDKSKKNVKRWFALFLSAWTVLVGVAFIVQVWRIFSFGEKAFTTERIGEYFRQIAVPVYIWLAAVIVGGAFFCIYPAPTAKVTPYVEMKCTLARLSKRLPVSTDEMKKYQKQRFVACIACVVAVVACVAVSLVYMLADVKLSAMGGFLAEHKEAERILRALVWFVAALVLAVGTAYFVDHSYKKEIAIAKAELAENAKKGIKAQASAEKTTLKSIFAKKFAFVHNKWFVLGVRVAIAVTSVVFIITGIFNGGMKAVLYKAITICSQCIGIG